MRLTAWCFLVLVVLAASYVVLLLSWLIVSVSVKVFGPIE